MSQNARSILCNSQNICVVFKIYIISMKHPHVPHKPHSHHTTCVNTHTHTASTCYTDTTDITVLYHTCTHMHRHTHSTIHTPPHTPQTHMYIHTCINTPHIQTSYEMWFSEWSSLCDQSHVDLPNLPGSSPDAVSWDDDTLLSCPCSV